MTCDNWLADKIPNRGFMDIGGICTGREKITFAAKHQPRKLTMVDRTHLTDPRWEQFGTSVAGLDVEFIVAEPESELFHERVDAHDVVHCDGLLHHSANPVHFLQQIANVTGEYLVLGAIHAGRCRSSYTPQSASIFVPACDQLHLKSVAASFNFQEQAPGISPAERDWLIGANPNPRSIWWLHSKPTIASMLAIVGFKVEEIFDENDLRVAKFCCRSIAT